MPKHHMPKKHGHKKDADPAPTPAPPSPPTAPPKVVEAPPKGKKHPKKAHKERDDAVPRGREEREAY